MRKNILSLISLIILTLGCSPQEETSLAGQYLPEKIDTLDLTRTSEIQVYVGDSLWEYINGGAELYHQYGFVEVATAGYKAGEIELVVDIYRFDTSLNAFGLYSGLRPPAPEFVELGVEGYRAPATVNFVKGEYLVRITGYDDTDDINTLILAMAWDLEKNIPGTTSLPDGFRKLYFVDKIKHTEKYFTESFMGKIYLTGVYTREYESDSDTLTAFVIEDPNKQKYMKWLEGIDTDSHDSPMPSDLLPGEIDYFVTRDDYYGGIVVVFQEGLMLGMINFQQNDSQLFVDWIQSMRNEI